MDKNLDIKILGYSNTPHLSLEGFDIINVKRGKRLFEKFFLFLFRGIAFSWLFQKKQLNPEVLVYYGSSLRILVPLWIYSRAKGIKLVVDIVEWYDYSHLPFGKYGPMAWDVHVSMTFMIPKCDGVIAISTLLEKYYQNKGLPTVRVPILFDKDIASQNQLSEIKLNPNFLNLVYAGFPGKKDLIFNVIDAIRLINSDKKKIEFHILGMNGKELEMTYGKYPGNSVKTYGKQPRSFVNNFLRSADFSVLFRPSKRYAMAGFPTKFVESLSMGLPVLANISSDLGMYLEEGFNGLIAKDHQVDSIILTLKRALELDRESYEKMKVNARASAEIHFNYRNFTKKFSDFFLEI
ncbi:glycosyltransferase [Aquiflexum lacus]|uniref:glycosyltransferase n=1 Tax=Aquiflexum lacus TaxID=2483805 RepID=UPI001894D414|nr:glycosyltransferase [Aquiflexum lacus]